MTPDDLDQNSENQEEAEESSGTSTLEVIDQAEEVLPEEQPKWADVDHSKLYVWVADAGNDRIQKFDGNGKFLFQFGKSAGTRPPYREGQFKGPFGVAVDKEGNVWVADTGAYFAGKTFGKVKLVPKLSPGKTREGLYGAVLATSLYSVAAAVYFDLSLIQTLLLMIISFFGTLLSIAGDLFISLLKRERGVKDTGAILPGHGGVLDRIDSITSAAPFFAILLHSVIFNA